MNIPEPTKRRSSKVQYACRVFLHGDAASNYAPVRSFTKLADLSDCTAAALRRACHEDGWNNFQSDSKLCEVSEIKLSNVDLNSLHKSGEDLAAWLADKIHDTQAVIDGGELDFEEECKAFTRLDKLIARYSKLSGLDALIDTKQTILKLEATNYVKSTEAVEAVEPHIVDIKLVSPLGVQ